MSNNDDAWQQAARAWKHLGSPVRPNAEDLRVITDWLPDPALRKPGLRAVVLGATPEYHALPWPADVTLTAVDRSTAMLRGIWPGRDTLHADWLALPLPDAGIDLVLCDGGLCLQSFPRGQHALVSAIARVLAPGGLLVLRCFEPPVRREPVAAVLSELLAGRLKNRDHLRLRLWLAMQQTPEAGVSNVASWQLLGNAEPRVDKLALLMNVDRDYLATMLTRPDDRMFHFAPASAVLDMFCAQPGGFRLEEKRVPGYTLGECCPTHVFRRM